MSERVSVLAVRKLRPSIEAIVLFLLALPVALGLLLTHHTDGSYFCRGSAISELLSPEHELGAQFRRETAFDAGYACNQSARHQVETAGGIVLVAGGLLAASAWRRRGREDFL